MLRVWLRTTHGAVEIAIGVVLVALGGLILYDALRLGPGWGEQGPEPGFFPFVLTILMVAPALGIVYASVTNPNRRPFFEVSQEVEDLLKVGIPIAFTVAAIPWGGLYIVSGLYLAFFMAWYGKFRWYEALAGGIALPVTLWLVLNRGFNISTPMSALYRKGILPF